MPTKSDKPKELKVTDKRIFTPEGEIREEFREEIKPAAAQEAMPQPPPASKPAEKPPEPKPQPTAEERRRSMADRTQAAPTAFTDFVQQLVMQAYMFLGMLRDPRQTKPMVDTTAAREMIDILSMLKDKTAGNLTPDEEDFLTTHLGELKLAFVQRTKTI